MLKRLWAILGVLSVVLACAGSASAATGDYIVVLKDGTDTGTAVKKARALGGTVTYQYRHALKGYAASIPEAAVQLLRADPRVLSVSPDGEMGLAKKAPPPPPPEQPPQALSASVNRIDGDVSSTKSGDGTGSVPVNVAVLDGGIQPDHPDLNVVGGEDCAPGQGFEDRDGHGTLVGGFIGALDNSIGRVGVAPGARLWAVRVAEPKVGRIQNSWFVCGLEFVAASRTDADPTNDIAVANMSLSGSLRDDSDCASTKFAPRIALCEIVRLGVVPVAAAGNDAVDLATREPAAYEEVLTVTAMAESDGQPGGLGGELAPCEPGEFDDTPASFSNFATLAEDKAHTLAAPGVCIGSTFIGSAYAAGTGTSFSAPLVAGTVALCLTNQCAGLTPQQIVQKIVADATAYNTANPSYGFSGDPLHSPDPNRYYGFLIRAGLY